MDKVLRIGTPLIFASALFLLGKSILNPFDLFMIILALFSILKNPNEVSQFVKKNYGYYTFSLFFLFSISLSIFGASDKLESLKNLFQISAYLLLIPLTFTIKHNIIEDIRYTFSVISVVFLAYSFLLFCVPKPVRLSAFDIHPNALGFMFALFAILNIKNLPLFLFLSFMCSLTFSRASLIGLSLSILIFSILERKPKFVPLALLPSLLSVSMPSLVQIYKNSALCSISKNITISVYPVDIKLVRIYDFDRVRLIKTSLEVFSKNPITGVGLGNFNQVVRRMCENGELNKDQCLASLPHRDPHNFILGFLAETGIIGLFSLFVFLIFLVKLLIRSRDSLGISLFTLSIFMSLLHPPVFFTRFMGPLFWYIILKDKFKIPTYEVSGKV